MTSFLETLFDRFHPTRLTRRHNEVTQHPSGAGHLIDHFYRVGEMVIGQQGPGRIIERCPRKQCNLGVGIDKDLAHVIVELIVGERQLFLLQRWVPVLGREVAKPEQPFLSEPVMYHVGLIVEYELAGEQLGPLFRNIAIGRLCDAGR